MRSVSKQNKGWTNAKNGSIYITLNQLVDMFYVSRFNRDNMHDVAEGEDIDNSRQHRVYNKSDVKELLSLFSEFFCWAINEKNISKIRVCDKLSMVRESSLPKLKYATAFDELCSPGQCKAGEYYITNGRYSWTLWFDGDTFQKMKDLWMNDPEFLAKKEELKPQMEEKNKNAKEGNKD